MSLITPVILVGGSGKRLWPLSRESMPKQIVPLLGKQSTFQQTLLRVADRTLFGKPVIATNKANRFMCEGPPLWDRWHSEKIDDKPAANLVSS